jgi:glycosyltransferase involved in cell wall biosynthesis
MSGPEASIIIRCYNEREHIGKLLYGIFKQRHDDLEVILVDSGSTDGTLEVAEQFPIEDIVYISPEEFSFGRALNMGCEAASGNLCVFASAHVYPRQVDWLESLLNMFGENVALVYGKQRGNEATKFPERRIFRRWFPEEDIERQSSPFCNNANCAIRRSVWKEFKYNETLTGLEDLDWAKRVQEAGWDLSYSANAEIIHVHDESPREVYNRYRREGIAYSQIMSEEEFGFTDFLRMFTYNTLADYWAAIREDELLDSLIEIPRFRLMQFFGTYRGFAQERPVSDRLRRRFYYPDTKGYPFSSTPERDSELLIEYPDSPRGLGTPDEGNDTNS